MLAIILAAGIGQRMGEFAAGRPKCLLQFNGMSLLRRHLRVLGHYGVDRVHVVTGYAADLVQAELAGFQVTTLYNPDFRRGSLVSLWTAHRVLDRGADVLLMDADVLYDHRMIGRLRDSSYSNCFLLDRDFEAGEEPVKLCVRAGRLIDFRKRIDKNLKFDFQGESVGFFRFSADTAAALMRRAADYVSEERLDEPYEEVIRDLLLQDPARFGYEDITGMPWIEIDFPEDVQRAERDILPRLPELPD
jgi:choline kinase